MLCAPFFCVCLIIPMLINKRLMGVGRRSGSGAEDAVSIGGLGGGEGGTPSRWDPVSGMGCSAGPEVDIVRWEEHSTLLQANLAGNHFHCFQCHGNEVGEGNSE